MCASLWGPEWFNPLRSQVQSLMMLQTSLAGSPRVFILSGQVGWPSLSLHHQYNGSLLVDVTELAVSVFPPSMLNHRVMLC